MTSHEPGCTELPIMYSRACPYCAAVREGRIPPVHLPAAPELPAKYTTRSSDFPRRPKR